MARRAVWRTVALPGRSQSARAAWGGAPVVPGPTQIAAG